MRDALIRAKLSIRENPLYFKHVYPSKERAFYKARVVRPGFDAVIEGYPRSANTFATFAFLRAQKNQVKIGNHFHNSSQFVLAARYGVPAMLCLRDPIEAATSFLMFRPELDARELFLRYIYFHRPLETLRGAFVVAPFEEIISDFNQSIERMNLQFSTSFANLKIGRDDSSQVFADIKIYREKRCRYYQEDSMIDPLRDSLPNAEKIARKERAQEILGDSFLRNLRSEARALYDSLVRDVPLSSPISPAPTP